MAEIKIVFGDSLLKERSEQLRDDAWKRMPEVLRDIVDKKSFDLAWGLAWIAVRNDQGRGGLNWVTPEKDQGGE